MNRSVITAIIISALSLLAACSTTSNLPEDEFLYTGIKSVTIEDKIDSEAEELALAEVEASLAYAPNNSFMGSSSIRTPLPVGLWIYNSLVNKQGSAAGRWLFNTFGTTPKTISSANPATRSKVATNLLQNYGYFNGYVDYSIVSQKNPRKQKISYSIRLGKPYHFDEIRYTFPNTEDSIITANQEEAYIRVGDQFNVSALQSERSRLVSLFRNNGFYYYRPDYITYYADSMQIPNWVKLLVTPSLSIPDKAQRQWKIGSIKAYVRDNKSGTMRGEYTDSIELEGLTIAHTGSQMPIKPRVMFRSFRFWNNQLFSQDKVDQTVTNLNNMQVFSRVQFTFAPADTTPDCSTLNVRLDATMDKLIDAELDFNITQKSNSQVGPNMSLLFSKRNAFRHGETLSLRLKGSYEWQTDKNVKGEQSKINSYESGIEASLAYPWTAFPWLNTRMFRYPTSTTFKISANHLNRAGFYRLLTFGAQADYSFQTSRREFHTFTPISLTFNRLMDTSARFDSITATNSALYVSLKDQFIPAMQYSFTYDNTADPRRVHKKWFQFTAKESGNIISALMAASGKSFSAENKKLLGSPYSQFVRLTAEFRRKYRLSVSSELAMRFQLGTLFTYGNSSVAPYSELFYVGGANSIRAFGVRTIGPGSYYDREGRGTYLDQSGEFKLEANAEYRFAIAGELRGAVFLDAGNVWNLRHDDSHPGGKLTASDFLQTVALGTGFGIRYDLQFLVLRLDLGIGIHAPYETGKSGYYNMPNFWDSLGLHFAVGYPF